MHVLIATDAWHPQVNGVVRTLVSLAAAAEALGAKISFLTPERMRTVALPSYPSIRLAVPPPGEIARRIEALKPDAVHIATEGPIGHLARRHCLRTGRRFTTSFHTRLADYASARFPIPDRLTWGWLRWFHNAGQATMAATPSLIGELEERGFHRVVRWPRGVDIDLFRPREKREMASLRPARPIFLSVGRVAVEKNLEAFLALDLPGSKVVVGDGPARQSLEARFPDAIFLGEKHGEDLAAVYAAADVFVFPSRTDTFGLVLLEALASGLPVAGFPVAATRDVVGDAPVAVLDEDLRSACLGAAALSRQACRDYAMTLTWEESAKKFLANLTGAGVCNGTPGRVSGRSSRLVRA
ncbi:glycosyl transferase, group 1 [Rhodovulum sp. PH10]|uniref:glycosyltransferase family 4 protein n=1 Tax=Rhodovulum sp. PH10 TaxID=1187851 RepID=UPI00027C2806|nr:glycosyltransferase family 1 protein [Rhodovulum sp. PH10]EJW10701.1 glycosyl transferase, group 1 [Rhodovulum sp. PH10]